MDMTKYYSQLVGCTITDFHFEEDDFGGDPFPVFTIEGVDMKFHVSLSCDEEGNGGGFAFIEGAR